MWGGGGGAAASRGAAGRLRDRRRRVLPGICAVSGRMAAFTMSGLAFCHMFRPRGCRRHAVRMFVARTRCASGKPERLKRAVEIS